VKRLFVCCDGTWNAVSDLQGGVPVPTNVVRFYNSLCPFDSKGVTQLSYYHPGVGTEELSWFGKVWAGSTGAGLIRNIKSAYYWLAQNYDKDDEIYLVGFSRGAFTARSLGGMLNTCGLIREAEWGRVDEASKIYHSDPKKGDTVSRQEQFKNDYSHSDLTIRFVGVWDTVGALGVPPDLTWWSRIPGFRFVGKVIQSWLVPVRFHDTRLAPIIKMPPMR
jgi:uncharacterized protein (DUF2235 family)